MFCNQRRVTQHIQQIEPVGVEKTNNTIYMLCSDAMYGSQLMDGKIKVLKISGQGAAGEESVVIEEEHFVETTYGVRASQFFQF